MQKREFPTFLNEQPTIIFGRTMRELLIILIGLALAYAIWTNLNALLPASNAAVIFCEGVCVIVILAVTLLVAFLKAAARPLEEWAMICLFYYVTPKLFLYMPDSDGISSTGDAEPRDNTNTHTVEDDGFI
jgi:hypothetical protein